MRLKDFKNVPQHFMTPAVQRAQGQFMREGLIISPPPGQNALTPETLYEIRLILEWTPSLRGEDEKFMQQFSASAPISLLTGT